MNSRSYIRIINAQVYAHHGVGEAEREVGGRYAFDLEIETDISQAAGTDRLEETIDYVEAYELTRDSIVGGKVQLIEAIVVRAIDLLLERFPTAISVTLRLRKLRAPIDGMLDAVEVEQCRRRID